MLPDPEPADGSTAASEASNGTSSPESFENTLSPANATAETTENDQLRSQLTDRIRQNPDIAADVLQSWLKDAA